MGTPNDQAVLQAIFNPSTPFGDVFDLGEEEKEEEDEGEHLTLECRSPHGLTSDHLNRAEQVILQGLLFLPPGYAKIGTKLACL
jgi:hypothetical protein